VHAILNDVRSFSSQRFSVDGDIEQTRVVAIVEDHLDLRKLAIMVAPVSGINVDRKNRDTDVVRIRRNPSQDLLLFGGVGRLQLLGAPYGNRTRVSAVKGRRPGPLDEGRAKRGEI
jgi:hypothetical protein